MVSVTSTIREGSRRLWEGEPAIITSIFLLSALGFAACLSSPGRAGVGQNPQVGTHPAPLLPEPVLATFLAHGFYGQAHREPLFVLSRSVGEDDFLSLLDEYDGRGNNTIFVLFSGHDQTVISPYRNKIVGGAVDEETVRHVTARLTEIRRRGLAVVGILYSDDTPKISEAPLRDLYAYQELVAGRWEPFVAAWCLAIEADEHLGDRVGPLLEHLRQVSERPVFNHQLPGGTDLSLRYPFDGHLHQYGFGRSCDDLQEETRRLVPLFNARGKRFIGLEYHLQGFSPDARALRECILAVPGIAGAG